MLVGEAVVVVTEPQPRDKRVMTRRDMWVYGTVIVLIAVVFAFVRVAQGADTASAVLAGASVMVVVGIGLTVNQVFARRRAKHRSNS